MSNFCCSWLVFSIAATLTWARLLLLPGNGGLTRLTGTDVDARRQEISFDVTMTAEAIGGAGGERGSAATVLCSLERS